MKALIKLLSQSLLLVFVAIISFMLAWLLHVDVLYLPGAFSLLLLLGRDEALFIKQKDLQASQHIFELSAGTQMANVAFNKYAEFCEKYIAIARDGATELMIHGPMQSEIISRLLRNLANVRQQYIVWVSSDVDVRLNEFEQPLRSMYGTAKMLEQTEGKVGTLNIEARRPLVQKMYDDYHRMLGIQFSEDKQPSEEARIQGVAEVTTFLKSLLGIDKLTELRRRALDKL